MFPVKTVASPHAWSSWTPHAGPQSVSPAGSAARISSRVRSRHEAPGHVATRYCWVEFSHDAGLLASFFR